MDKALVSIIVPVYNVERYLKKCIESIINQTYSDIEVILINDGSTDSSYTICKVYAEMDDRIILINKKNEGLSSARQNGIDRASGKYFCTVDSDDYIENNFVEKMFKKISSENSDICVCATRHFNNEMSRVRGFKHVSNFSDNITLDNLIGNYNNLLGKYYMSDSWNKIYRMDFVKKSKVYFTLDKEFNGTDLLYNHLLMLHLPKISVLNDPLYNYQILENSRVRRKNKELQKGFFIIFDKIVEEIDKIGYSELLNDQLGLLYLNFQRNAAQDIFNSGVNIIEIREKLKLFISEHNRYLLFKGIKLSPNKISTNSMKLFFYCLKSKSIFNIILYLLLRKKVLK